jgi:MFS family permease
MATSEEPLSADRQHSIINASPDDNAFEVEDVNGRNSSSKIAFRWVAVTAASAVLFIGVGYANTFGVFQEHYQAVVFPDEPPPKIILIGSLASSLYLVLGAFTGRFADLVGHRISLAIGSALMVGSMFAASVCRTYWQIFLCQGLMFGLGVAFAYLPAVTISQRYFGGQRHGLANGVIVSGGALGGCVLPYLVRKLIVQHGLAQTFRILGYIATGVLGPSVLLLRPRTTDTHRRKTSSRGNHRPPLMDFSLLYDSRFIVLLVAGTIAMIGFLPRYFLITPSAVAKGIPDTYAAWLLGLMNGLSIIGRIGIGWLADRHGKVAALAASFILCGLGHLVFWLPGVTLSPGGSSGTAKVLFTLFSAYTGIFGSGFISLFPVVVADLFGSVDLASKVGLLNTATGLGALAGPSAVYAIIGDGGRRHWTVGVLSAGLFMFVGGILMAGLLGRLNKLDQRRPQTGQID